MQIDKLYYPFIAKKISNILITTLDDSPESQELRQSIREEPNLAEKVLDETLIQMFEAHPVLCYYNNMPGHDLESCLTASISNWLNEISYPVEERFPWPGKKQSIEIMVRKTFTLVTEQND